MRVLVDRHHADLFFSLQVLFEDKLGKIVYTPVGHDWWDEGIWRFGEVYGDDRLARQYLSTDGWLPYPENDPYAGLWQMRDSHHPDRLILGVELRLVRATAPEWEMVVASVQENQRGFARFASEIGAKYVYQVGNTRQQVDWDLDPLAIVSSEVPIHGRALLYHQTIPDSFTYRPPTDQRTVRSFVNCFPQIDCYITLANARPLLWGPVYVHGIDGPDGNIERTSEIAELMAASGWGWHDKPQGDGFGHILHDWAAIGRPLIGHGSHYRGLMGEGFWQDGITCLDLDKRSLREIANTVNTISPEDHEAMCRAIRAEFDRIDYPSEVEAIRRFLA